MSAKEEDKSTVILVSKVIRAKLLTHLTAYQLAALMVLAEHVGTNGLSWPSLATVAELSGQSIQQARRSIRALVACGIVTEAEPATPTRSTRYRLTLPALPAKPGTTQQVGPSYPTDSTPPIQQVPATQQVGPIQQVPRGIQQKPDPLRDPLNLSEGETPRANRKPTKSRKAQRAPDKPGPHPQFRELCDHWLNLAAQRYGERPLIGGNQFGLMGQAINKLLDASDGDAEKVKAVLDRSSKDGRKPDIHEIARFPDRYKPFGLVRPEAMPAAPKPRTVAPPLNPEPIFGKAAS